MTLWNTTIGQGGTRITQERITDIRVKENFGHIDFSVRIASPTTAERAQAKGRMDTAIIQIKRGTDVLVEGFIEDVKIGADYVQYTGRSFLVLMGYSTASTTSDSGVTEAEFSNAYGYTIIANLITNYCTDKDSEVTSSVSLTDIYGANVKYEGDVKLHGKKVYQIVREMCQSYGHDLWSSTTWVGDDVTVKTINVGEKTRGSSISPHTTLKGGVHLKGIPIVTYRASDTINCLRVIGGGTGKDKVSVFVEDAASVVAIGYVEGETYHSNMIRSVATAQSVGEAIIDAKKDPIEEIDVETALYINDLEYGDWVRVVDTYTNLDTTKRIKSITRVYNINSVDSMILELGDKFDNYQNIINDLTKGDVDSEPDMVKAGGSLRMTANDPPSDWVRVDAGQWYGTDGIIHSGSDNGVCGFLAGSSIFPSGGGQYRKAAVQIKDTGQISYVLGDIETSDSAAAASVVSVESENTPLGEIVLNQLGSSDAVEVIHGELTSGKSYIYRDARPIVGSAISNYGGAGYFALTTDDTWAASTVYAAGNWVGATVADSRSYKCTTTGTSGGTEPTWVLTVGATTTDGSCIWTTYYEGIVVDDISGIANLDVHVRPVGDGVVYLG